MSEEVIVLHLFVEGLEIKTETVPADQETTARNYYERAGYDVRTSQQLGIYHAPRI